MKIYFSIRAQWRLRGNDGDLNRQNKKKTSWCEESLRGGIGALWEGGPFGRADEGKIAAQGDKNC